ncbi:MAG: putative metal-dependent hydrolase [Flavobacterium sp.]|nr:putative metal-dependent hydrolase [Pedobacter sp.]
MIEDLQYPIGKFIEPSIINDALIQSGINVITHFPAKLKQEVSTLKDYQLDTPYRPEGWSIRQVVHHCADSHMNSVIRFKLALTEDEPVIKPYYEDRWANLSDNQMDINPSLLLLDSLHIKWVYLINSFTDIDFKKFYVHPDNGKMYTLELAVILYAWHCNHHLAHIKTLKHTQQWA